MSIEIPLHISDTNYLSDVWFINVFSHSEFFVEQEFFILMRSNLSFFLFMYYVFGSKSFKKVIYFANLCLIISIFRLFKFKVIIYMVELTSAILLVAFHLPLIFLPMLLSSCLPVCYLNNFENPILLFNSIFNSISLCSYISGCSIVYSFKGSQTTGVKWV